MTGFPERQIYVPKFCSPALSYLNLPRQAGGRAGVIPHLAGIKGFAAGQSIVFDLSDLNNFARVQSVLT